MKFKNMIISILVAIIYCHSTTHVQNIDVMIWLSTSAVLALTYFMLRDIDNTIKEARHKTHQEPNVGNLKNYEVSEKENGQAG